MFLVQNILLYEIVLFLILYIPTLTKVQNVLMNLLLVKFRIVLVLLVFLVFQDFQISPL